MAVVVPIQSDGEVELAFPGSKPIKVVIGADELVANPPSAGLVMLVAAAQSGDETESVAAIMDLLKHIFSDEDYAILREYLVTGALAPEPLAGMVRDLIEQWSDVPTSEPSGSSPSPKTSGKSSTAKRRSTARTSGGTR